MNAVTDFYVFNTNTLLIAAQLFVGAINACILISMVRNKWKRSRSEKISS